MQKLTCFLLFVVTLLFYKLSFANSCRVLVHNSQASTYAREVTVVIGKRLKLEYESGVVVDGIVKKLTLDADGNLQVITFANVMANKQDELLFDKAWGDFDIAVANHVEKFELIP